MSEITKRAAANAVLAGFNAWAAKPHNAKWVKRIDGTPIPNDLPVCIQAAIMGLPAGDVVAEGDPDLRQSAEAILDLVACRCHPAFKDRGLHDPQCNCDFDGEASALVAAALCKAPAVKVKALEWENSVNGRWIGTPPIKIANMAFWVFSCSGGFKRMTGDGPPMYYPTLEDAKAAAQSDYEARILAALEGGEA